jgi:outer membrane protein, multidrug efflux system
MTVVESFGMRCASNRALAILKRARPLWTMLQSLCLVSFLGGCLLHSEQPDLELEIPQTYTQGPRNPHIAEAALPSLEWWRGFHSGELTGIIDEALAANFDIAAAIARIMQADAQARITGAVLLPAADLGGTASHLRTSQSTAAGGSAVSLGGSERNLFAASLTASYELDFWGKNRAALHAAVETALASRFDREVVDLTTIASVATAYFQILTAQDRLRVAHKNLQSATRVLNLVKQRANAGTASALEISQQEAVVATQRAAIPPLEQTLTQNRNILAVLMARSPESIHIRGGSLSLIGMPRVTPGLPSELLTQRPDIREAEARLAAAHANVYNARAQFLPSITLTGEGGYQSAILRTLLRPESALFTVAAGLTQPIFEGGRLIGNLDLQKAREDELLQNYRKAVISAFSDVENALDALRQTTLREGAQREVVISSRRAFDISEQRLREGTTDLITVLQTQQTLFQAADTLVLARLAHLQAIVSLYQALGGGWRPMPWETTDAR